MNKSIDPLLKKNIERFLYLFGADSPRRRFGDKRDVNPPYIAI